MADVPRQDHPNNEYPEPSGCLPTLVRLIWLAGGNAFLVILAGLIVQKGALSALDAVYWALVGFLVLIRWYDIARLDGLTAESRPATPAHWRRYSVMLLLAALLIWGGAHAVTLIHPK